MAVHDNLPFLKWLETQLSQIFHQSGPATERKVPMMRTLAEKKDFRNRYFGAPPGAVSLNLCGYLAQKSRDHINSIPS